MHIRLFLLILSLLAIVHGAWGYDKDYYATQSNLASGRWVKVAVDTTGIYQLDYSTLLRWGFPNPDRVRIHGYGAVQGAMNTFDEYPDDLPPVHTLHTPDGRILFYAEGPVKADIQASNKIEVTRNFYSDHSYYFITEGENGYNAEPHPFVSNTTYRRSYATMVDFREKESVNYGKGGAIFHGPDITPDNPDAYNFRIRNPHGAAEVIALLQAAVRTSTSTSMLMNFEASGSECEPLVVPIQPIVSAHKLWVPVSGSGPLKVAEGLTDVDVKAIVSMDRTYRGTMAAVDYAAVVYDRSLVMNPDEPVLFTQIYRQTTNNQNLLYSSVPDDFEVWDVTYSWDVHPYTQQRSGDNVVVNLPFRNGVATRMVAFDSSADFPVPTFAGEVENQNLHAIDVPEMVIVATPMFQKEAQELAQLHREKGMEVEVVLQQHIFNEFGSGAPSAAAIRRFNRMLFDRQPSRFRFMTIYGAATWDPRHIAGVHPDFPLTYLAEERYHVQEDASNYANDMYFGMLSDNSTSTTTIYRLNADIAVGRIPARSSADAQAYNAKVKKILDSKADSRVYLNAITSSCEGDAYTHYDHNTELGDTLLYFNPLVNIRRADELIFPLVSGGKASDAQRSIAQGLSKGAGLFSYCGHGNPKALGNWLWDVRANARYTHNHFPLAVLATCNLAPFDRETSLSEQMLFAPQGGMAAVIAACREVYLERNKELSYMLAEVYASAKPGTTMGEVFSHARNCIVERGMSQQLGSNTLCYNFLGDPALPLWIPEGKIVTESVDGRVYAGTEFWLPGATVELAGYVTGTDGQILTDYEGEITLDLYRAPQQTATVWQETQRYPKLDYTILQTYRGKVRNGRWAATIKVPVSNLPGLPGHISMTTVNSEGKHPLAGNMPSVTIGNPGDVVDSPAENPVITLLEVNAAGTEGTLQFSAPTRIPDGTSAFIARPALRLDGKRLDSSWLDELTETADGIYEATIILPEVRPGQHSLTLSVSDCLGRSTSATIEFNRELNAQTAHLALESDEPFVQQSASIGLVNNSETTPVGRLVVTDSHGHTVFSRAATELPYSWDLRTTNGEAIPDGHYRAWFITPTHAIAPLDITVMR